MARGSHRGRHAAVDGEYERDEIARNTQLEARCQRMEEQFEALTKQLAALAIVNQPQNRSPTLRFVKEDEVDYNVEDEMENPLVGHRRRREEPLGFIQFKQMEIWVQIRYSRVQRLFTT